MRKLSAAVRFSGLVGLAFFSAAGCAEVENDGIGVTEESLVGDAYVNTTRDTHVRQTAANKNYGNETTLRVDSLDTSRAVVQFTTADISAAVAGRVVEHAYLELTVADCGAGWGFGQKVGVHRLKQASTEGGATWNCANDTNPGNNTNNCTVANSWKMTGPAAQLAFVSTASDTESLWVGMQGKIALEVTADVQAFLAGSQVNNGWLIKRVNELLPGFTRFRSTEASNGRPRLVLDLGNASDAGVCVPTAANDVTCNGVDDDCNGTADEDFVSSATSCGIGACAATGATMCVGGAVVNSCTAGSPAANDATCDGVDNDCNGQVDEDFVAGTTSCGVGACAATGATSCVAGNVVSSCTPGAPAANDASCNGVDNDCNGQVDEDFVATPTSCGVGACAATGMNSCVAGSIVNTCMPSAPAPNDATCNNIDDDCNGTRDEDFVATTTSCGVGSCASFGSTLCSSGNIVNTCIPGTPAANDATCNNRDNDCDGSIDEDFVSTPTTCGLNACASTGATSCVSGAVVNSCMPVANCEGECGDGNDNDNDGDADCNDFDCDGVGSCDNGVGSACEDVSECAVLGPDALCLSEGSSGIPGGYCSAACDGSPGSCPGDSECLGGLCLNPCDGGGMCGSGEACIPVEGPGACIPVCTIDDDCTGTNVCNTGTGFCEAVVCAADDTTCDGFDDDCDGNVDEDFAGAFGGDVSCGADSCFEIGSLVCVAGSVTDTCGAPAPSCTQEVACGDSADNDGDSFADCNDPDCEQTPACLAAASPVGGTCAINSDCRSVTGPAVCLAAPGGYCSNFCDTMDPSTCPDNATCNGGICLVRCNPEDGAAACSRPDHTCILDSGDYVCLPPA